MTSRLSAFAALNNDSESESENESLTAASVDTASNGTGNNTTFQLVLPVYTSNFTLSSINTKKFDDYQLIALPKDGVLVLKGQYSVMPYHGSFKIDNYTPKASEILKVNASNITALPTIVSVDSGLESSEFPGYFTVIKVMNHNDNMESITNLFPNLRSLYYSDKNFYDNYTFASMVSAESNRFATNLHPSWDNQINKISATTPAVFIIGSKNSGKSTFLKLLLNKLVSSKRTVQVLDMDPGQPEFCLPGCISLSEVSHPIIGTKVPDETTKSTTKFIGFTSPNIQPVYYMDQLKSLISLIDASKPLLINAPGWVKGFGVEIINFLQSNISFSHVIQLTDGTPLELFDTDINIINVPCMNRNECITYPPNLIRKFKLISYMHRAGSLYDFNPLVFRSPLRVSYSTENNLVKLKNFHGIIGVTIFDSQGIVIEDVINSIECQFMAICSIDGEDLDSTNTFTSNNHSPNMINEWFVQSRKIKCHGLSIIHSVDPVNKTVNLYTPINTENLPKHLILVKGREEVPIEEIYSNLITKTDAAYWSTFDINAPPFVSSSLSSNVLGSKTVSIRRNIYRR